jgi:hypothetical protein
MNRREFNKLLGFAGLGAIGPWSLPGKALTSGYNGPLYITIAAIGGWDVTSFCDPKENIAGERTINTWADQESIAQAGNIRYAPVAANQAFFERFYQDMLVINGIDTQTNSHDDGVRHTWSGRLGFGYPSFGSIVSASIAPELPLSLVHAAGYSETAGIARFSRLQNPDIITNLVNDSEVEQGNSTYTLFEEAELNRIEQYQNARLHRLMANGNALPRQVRGLNNLYLANATRGELDAFGQMLPEEFESDNVLRSAQLALLAYQSGLSVACQLGFSGFDTHQNHDGTHFDPMERLTSLVHYIYDQAEAGGFADRLVVCISSDFGRRPFYNAGGGKDHWPIGSAIVLQRGAPWGNRVVGSTDAMHNANSIDPLSLAVDQVNGVTLQPKHLQQAMRQLAGVDQSSVAGLFPLNAEDVDFFNPARQTG